MDLDQIRESLRRRHKIAPDQPVGRMSVMAKDVAVRAERTLVGTATTQDVDLSGEVVLQGGCDPTYFLANKRVFLDHDTAFDNVVGKLRHHTLIHDRAGSVVARKIAVGIMDTAVGAEVLRVAEEIGIGLSIGFTATDAGPPTMDEQDAFPGVRRVIREWQWIETSLTAVPCNVSCQVDALAQPDESKASELSRLVRQKAVRRETAELLGLPRAKTIVVVG